MADTIHSEHHVVGLPVYFMVFGILIVGTILTYFVATIDLDGIFPGANTLVALLIGFTKATFVVLFFMHVKYSSKLTKLMVVAGLFWLGIMFLFTMSDYLTRSAETSQQYQIQKAVQEEKHGATPQESHGAMPPASEH